AIKATVTKTEMTPDMGEGTKFHYAVYYDPSTDQCSPFHYKGEKGNANRFEHERECIRNCSDNAENIYPMEDAKACTLKKMVGGCDGSFLRYYYDPIHDKCKKFLYSGCLGNGNRFFDSGSCNNTCVGIHGEHIFPLSYEPDTPIGEYTHCKLDKSLI
uniref:BPTI/Kunitz inhibitor domain-containing protein n=1 Tax=Salarias fasciatus TaxID=181472 RepID=A0A672J3Y8_SALFA